MKYLVVVGGVMSGLGKGVTACSLGVILKACGLRVTYIKIDPYLNRDAGTMSPGQHGEVFVLDDGGEVDLDLGHYERFLDVTLTKYNNFTAGQIYHTVLDKERRGVYLGQTVQTVPHVTDEIKDWIHKFSRIPVDGKEGPADVCIIELGGTVGDMESMALFEALRQLSFSVGSDNFCLILLSLIHVLGSVGEQKTKPTQHCVRELRALGLTPNLLACRSTQPLLDNTKQKLSQLCHVPLDNILSVHDVPNIYSVPLLLRNQNAHHSILKQLNLRETAPPDLTQWTKMVETSDNLTSSVRIAVVGKYVGRTDPYLCVENAILHAGMACSRKPVIDWIESSNLEDFESEESEEENAKVSPEEHVAAWETLMNASCVIVPGGFGDRGIGGMIMAAKYCRENNVPFLGICLGMQISVIEYARSVLGLDKANSIEIDPETQNPVVIFMEEGSKTHMGSTMRLGSRRTLFHTLDCISSKLYHNSEYVDERHRHRYEVNPDIIEHLEEAGLKFVGRDETGRRMEIVELSSHPFYVGVQFHPEYKSRPGRPSPLFLGLLLAATGQLEGYLSRSLDVC